MLKLHTIARDRKSYNAEAIFDGKNIMVQKGSVINLNRGEGFKPSKTINEILQDKSLYDDKGILQKDISFSSLSTAASFVTGRTANGMICWKTEDDKYVRNTLNKKR